MGGSWWVGKRYLEIEGDWLLRDEGGEVLMAFCRAVFFDWRYSSVVWNWIGG